MNDCLEEICGKTMYEDPRKPEELSNEFIARILEGRHEATRVQFNWFDGGQLYKDILAEAAKRIRGKELEEDDQFAPHYEDDPQKYNVASLEMYDATGPETIMECRQYRCSRCHHHATDHDSYCRECGARFVRNFTYDNPNGVEVMSCRDALEQLMVQDVCVQHGFEEGNEFCSDCGGRPEKFGGAGTCPWEYAKAALNATDNWDFETRKRMDFLCREIEHLRKRIKFLESCNDRLTRKWEEQLAESCSRCARLGEKPRACDTMKAEDLIDVVRSGVMTSIGPTINGEGVSQMDAKSLVDAAVSTAIKCAYETDLVVMEKKNEPGRPTA